MLYALTTFTIRDTIIKKIRRKIMSLTISIIVPVYNIEQYIKKCIDSITSQTYTNLEILCVDDGSSDGSADIIKSIAQSDNRIHYFYQENAGVSAARNYALNKATGDYIIFVDGDDYLHPRAIEIYVDCAKETDADVIFSDYFYTYSTNEPMQEITDYSYTEFKYRIGSSEDSSKMRPVGNKMIKATLAKSESFLRGIYVGEDLNYVIKMINKSKKVQYIDHKLYYIFIRANSASRKSVTSKELTVFKAYEDLYDSVKDSSKKNIVAYALQGIIMLNISHRTLTKYLPVEKDFKQLYKSTLKKYLFLYIKSNYIPLSQKIRTLAFLVSRPLYELARLVQDPTMADFYKNRKVNKKH